MVTIKDYIHYYLNTPCELQIKDKETNEFSAAQKGIISPALIASIISDKGKFKVKLCLTPITRIPIEKYKELRQRLKLDFTEQEYNMRMKDIQKHGWRSLEMIAAGKQPILIKFLLDNGFDYFGLIGMSFAIDIKDSMLLTNRIDTEQK